MARKSRQRYRHAVDAVFGKPWMITEDKMADIASLVRLRAAGHSLSREEIASRIGFHEDDRPPVSETQGQVGLLHLHGVIHNRMNMFSDVSGGTSSEQFEADFQSMVENDAIKAIVIDIDSPGGEAAGSAELSEAIHAARGSKPIIAVANGMMASAAYLIGSSADEIVAAPSALVGSIGTIWEHQETSKMDAELGITRTLVRAGRFKAEMNDAEPLSEAGLAHMQETVDRYYEQFVSAVARNLGVSAVDVRSGFGEGRAIIAGDALREGMIHRLGTLADVLAELGVSSSNQGGAGTNPAFAFSFDMGRGPVNKSIFEALVQRKLVSIDASEETANAALLAFFAARGTEVPENEAETVAAINTPKLAAPTAPPEPVVTPPRGVDEPAADSEDRTENIMAAVKIAGLENPFEVATSLIADRNLSVAAALDRIQEMQAAETPSPGVSILSGDSEDDKFHETARDAVLLRYHGGELPGGRKPAAGAEQESYLGRLPKLAAECLSRGGLPDSMVRRLNDNQIARMVYGSVSPDLGIRMGGDGFSNITGMYSNVLLDAANVTLRDSYSEANTTFQQWARRGQSPVDFKDVHRTILGEISDPKAIPESGEFEESTTTDGKEAYKLTLWGEIFSISWQVTVNDGLGAFLDTPSKQGRAMIRKQNKLVYGILTDNPTLQNDSLALFHSSHSNLAGSGAAPSFTTLDAAETAMAKQGGLNSDVVALNTMPAYFIAPRALKGTAERLFRSPADPAASNGNPGVTNIFQGEYTRIYDAVLDTLGDTTAWYLAADPRDVDTIEYAYLEGLETPQLDSEQGFQVLGTRFRIYQAFATKAIDYRGLYKNPGA